MRLIVLLLALAGCAAPRPPASPAVVTVQSFNVRYHNPADEENAWPHRIGAVAEIQSRAHLVGVQEALPEMLHDLDARVRGVARVGVGRDADGGGEASAIYYRTDRFDLLDHGTFWLSGTPEVPGSVGWDAALPRICTWARVRHRGTGAVLVHANTHFDHRGEVARRESARLLVARLKEIAGDDPLVLTGDINATPESEPYRILTRAFRDAREVTEKPPEGPAATWNAFGRADPTERIDYVFVSPGVRVLRFTTLGGTIGETLGTDDARYPSDHFPVQAEIEIAP